MGACKIAGATQLRGCRRRFEQNVKINIELKHRWPRASITEEAANFVTAHYEAKNRHFHNPKPRYNAGDPKKGGSNLNLFKGDLAPAGASNSLTLDFREW